MSHGPRVEFFMPEGWVPARCSVREDMEKSCPFSFRGCYTYKPEACPIVKLVAGTRIAIPIPAVKPRQAAAMPRGWKFKTTCYGCRSIKAPQMAPPCDNCIGVDGQRRNYRPGGKR